MRIKAILQALLVTFIWATSWVLIKFGLEDVPALLFAGLRYGIGAVCLIVILSFSPQRKLIREVILTFAKVHQGGAVPHDASAGKASSK